MLSYPVRANKSVFGIGSTSKDVEIVKQQEQQYSKKLKCQHLTVTAISRREILERRSTIERHCGRQRQRRIDGRQIERRHVRECSVVSATS